MTLKEKRILAVKDLKEKIAKNLVNYPTLRLYVNSWIIGSLDLFDDYFHDHDIWICGEKWRIGRLSEDFIHYFFGLSIADELSSSLREFICISEIAKSCINFIKLVCPLYTTFAKIDLRIHD